MCGSEASQRYQGTDAGAVVHLIVSAAKHAQRVAGAVRAWCCAWGWPAVPGFCRCRCQRSPSASRALQPRRGQLLIWWAAALMLLQSPAGGMTKVQCQLHAPSGVQHMTGIHGLLRILTGTDDEPNRSSGRKSSGMRLPGMPLLSCTCQDAAVDQQSALRSVERM